MINVSDDIVARATNGLYKSNLQPSKSIMLMATLGLYIGDVFDMAYKTLCGDINVQSLLSASMSSNAAITADVGVHSCD